MDQYSNTILHLPDYQVTSEATIEERQTEQGTVMVQTIHGMVTTSIPDSCQHCGGRLHANQHLRVTLQHLVIGDCKIVLDVGYQQQLCTECHKTTSQNIPFKQQGHFITTCFHLQIEGLLRRSDMTAKGLACALLTNRKLVREVDKALLGDRYGEMLPTHPSAHICVDEFSLHKGHRYATVVLDWETGEILFLEEGNSERQLLHFFRKVGRQWMLQVRSVSMDMNAQYCKAVESIYPHIAIVYDAFHITKNFNDRIITELRRLEQNRLQEHISKSKAKAIRSRKAMKDADAAGREALELEIAEQRLSAKEAERKYTALKGSRYVLTSSRVALQKKDELAKAHNRELAIAYENKGLALPDGQRKWSTRNVQRLDQVLGESDNLSLAFFLGDQLKAGLDCTDEQEMKDGLEQWLALSESFVVQIPMLKAFNRMMSTRMEGIVSRVRFPISNGPLEGCNNMIKTVRRQAYGYRDTQYFFLKIWDRSRRYPKNRSIAKAKKNRIQARVEWEKSHKKIS